VPGVLVECLNCGETRWRKPRRRHSISVGDCCPRCAYVGWAPTGTLDETLRRSLFERPLDLRRRRLVAA
jgi:hypothetical protein